jgi:hypothetical protein
LNFGNEPAFCVKHYNLSIFITLLKKFNRVAMNAQSQSLKKTRKEQDFYSPSVQQEAESKQLRFFYKTNAANTNGECH